jgi:hypothetical protein
VGRVWELRPYDRSRCDEHAGCDSALRSVVRVVTPGVVMVAPSETLRNASRAQCEGPRQGGEVPKSAAEGSIKAGVLHLASLQRS